jgi:hypothetical protein
MLRVILGEKKIRKAPSSQEDVSPSKRRSAPREYVGKAEGIS